MKKLLSLLVVSVLAAGLAAAPAEAKRVGGGASIGKQRSSPAMREAPKEAPRAQTPPSQAAANPAAAAPAGAAAAAAAPKPSFMNRWGGLIAGVGAGALLASMFGGSLGGLGSAMGGLLNILIVAGLLYLAYRFFMSRRRGATPGGMQFAGAPGNFAAAGPSFAPRERIEPASSPSSRPEAAVAPGVQVPPGFEIEPFVRQAQSAFLRLQAANDAGDLADIRETSTPEVYAELAMQMRDRGSAPQKTEIVSLDANLLEVVTEGEYTIASLRYSGLVREVANAEAVPFDEVWHLRSAAGSVKGPWLISGIQQLAA